MIKHVKNNVGNKNVITPVCESINSNRNFITISEKLTTFEALCKNNN